LPDDIDALRFLEANSFILDTSLDHYRRWVKWRTDKDIDNIKPPEQRELIESVFPNRVGGFAKDGSPIYMEKTGQIHIFAVPSIDPSQFIQNHTLGMEQMLKRMKESSKKVGKPVRKIKTIIDLTGLGLSHRHAIGILKIASDTDTECYPGVIGDIFIINCPWVVPGLWELVKSILPVSTITQIHLLGADFKDKLLEHIDADQLPEEYGGTAPNILVRPEAEVKAMVLKDKSGLALTEKMVLAGEKFEVVLDGQKGDEFKWSFDVSDQYDIGFSIDMKAADSDKTVAVKIASRTVSSKGSYVADKSCRVTFQWDNSYSYWNSKSLKYHASVSKST
jgi:hypothetical protein